MAPHEGESVMDLTVGELRLLLVCRRKTFAREDG
jgi:hypothetical protein